MKTLLRILLLMLLAAAPALAQIPLLTNTTPAFQVFTPMPTNWASWFPAAQTNTSVSYVGGQAEQVLPATSSNLQTLVYCISIFTTQAVFQYHWEWSTNVISTLPYSTDGFLIVYEDKTEYYGSAISNQPSAVMPMWSGMAATGSPTQVLVPFTSTTCTVPTNFTAISYAFMSNSFGMYVTGQSNTVQWTTLGTTNTVFPLVNRTWNFGDGVSTNTPTNVVAHAYTNGAFNVIETWLHRTWSSTNSVLLNISSPSNVVVNATIDDAQPGGTMLLCVEVPFAAGTAPANYFLRLAFSQ